MLTQDLTWMVVATLCTLIVIMLTVAAPTTSSPNSNWFVTGGTTNTDTTIDAAKSTNLSMVNMENGQNMENAANPVEVELKCEQENVIVQLQRTVVKVVLVVHSREESVILSAAQVSHKILVHLGMGILSIALGFFLR